MFNVDLLKSQLNKRAVFNNVVCSSQTKSTQDDLWQLYSTLPGPSLIVTNHQTGGRGRGLNKWVASPNKSIACSFILEQVFNLKNFNFHALTIPLSIVRGIKKHLGIEVSIKWPNDIVYNKHKLGGVLLESKQNAKKYIFNVGIGINVNESNKDLPLHLENQATSLKIICGEEIEREILLASILNELYSTVNNYTCSQIISSWEKHCNHINCRVSFKHKKKNVEGIFKKINKNGQAIIENNNKSFYYSGAIRVL